MSDENMENRTNTEADDFLTSLLDSLDEDTKEDAKSGDRDNESDVHDKDDIDNDNQGGFAEMSRKYFDAIQKEALRLMDDPEFNAADADIRFSTAISLRAVRNSVCCIIGAGGLGNWQWRILLSMGFRQLIIYDDDVVGIENIGPQAHSIFDIGLPKVEAVRRAALQYRGISIIARNKRVMSLNDIINDLGYMPDVIIGCTDSADFRNTFINSLEYAILNGIAGNKLPQLWIDYRMALGDWNAYIVPAHSMAFVSTAGWSTRIRRFFDKYKAEACFNAEDAVQEPCTERAISYTGASVASFTGALLHWWFSTGKQELSHSEKLHYGFLAQKGTQFSWKMSYSSRDFEPVSQTRRESFLMGKLAHEKRKSLQKEETLTNFLSAYTGIKMSHVWRTGSVDDLLESNPGSVCVFEETMMTFIEFPDGKFRRLNIHRGEENLYTITETVDDTVFLEWNNITRYVCTPEDGMFLSALKNIENPFVIVSNRFPNMYTLVSITKTNDFVTKNGGNFYVEDFGSGYIVEAYTVDDTNHGDYRIMSFEEALDRYRGFHIIDNCKNINLLHSQCEEKRRVFVESAKLQRASHEDDDSFGDKLEECSPNEETTQKDVGYIDSHDLQPGDVINVGVPRENYKVLETGVRLKLCDMTTGDEFYCRHFSHRVMRIPLL